MTELQKIKASFVQIGINALLQGTVENFHIRFYGFPQEWEGNRTLQALGALLVFDSNGTYLGAGVGDEQPDVFLREEAA